MKPYADTNFLTRLYLAMPESTLAETMAAGARSAAAEPVPIAWLHRVEFVNALQLHVFVGRQPGHVRVTPEQAAVALETFRADVASAAFFRSRRIREEDLAGQVEALALRHTAKHGFRIYDLLHVASAIFFGSDTFWSFDRRAVMLAKREGLKTPGLS